MIDSSFIEALADRKRGYRILRAHMRCRFLNELEDVWQDAVATLWEKRHKIDRPDGAIYFFYRILVNKARDYRDRKMDRAEYCEVQDWMGECSSPDDPARAAERREREIHEAGEQLAGLLLKVRLKHRLAYSEWRDRGYRCETNRQSQQVHHMLKALRRAAGVLHSEEEKRLQIVNKKRRAGKEVSLHC